MDDQRQDPHTGRLRDLPDHEDDSDVAGTAGGGVMSEGGTAVDRGTGTLSGDAQGERAGDDEDFGKGPGDELLENAVAYDAWNTGSVPRAVAGPSSQAGAVPTDPDGPLGDDIEDDDERSAG